MKKKTMIVLDAYELECEIAHRLGMTCAEVDIRQVLFYDDYQNDCCKYCSVESIEESFCETEFYNLLSKKEIVVLREVLKLLKEEGIEGDFLIDVSW